MSQQEAVLVKKVRSHFRQKYIHVTFEFEHTRFRMILPHNHTIFYVKPYFVQRFPNIQFDEFEFKWNQRKIDIFKRPDHYEKKRDSMLIKVHRVIWQNVMDPFDESSTDDDSDTINLDDWINKITQEKKEHPELFEVPDYMKDAPTK